MPFYEEQAGIPPPVVSVLPRLWSSHVNGQLEGEREEEGEEEEEKEEGKGEREKEKKEKETEKEPHSDETHPSKGALG